MKGWVYVIECDAAPDLVKIGQSAKHPEHRMQELQSTGVPGKLRLLWCVMVEGYAKVEREVHRTCHAERMHNEWFEMDWQQARAEILRAADDLGCKVVLIEGPMAETAPEDVIHMPDESEPLLAAPLLCLPAPEPDMLNARKVALCERRWELNRTNLAALIEWQNQWVKRHRAYVERFVADMPPAPAPAAESEKPKRAVITPNWSWRVK